MSRARQLGATWKVARLINLRHLLGRRRRTLLTVAGIAASVSLVVAITIVNETLRSAIDGTTHGLAGDAAVEVAPLTSESLPEGSVSKLDRVHGARAVVPIVRQTTALRHGSASRRTFLIGVPGNLSTLFPEGLGDLGRQMGSPGLRDGVLLSRGLASSLQVGRGDRIVARTATGPVRLRVADVLGRNPFAAVNGGEFGLLSLRRAERVLGQRGKASVAYVAQRAGYPLRRLKRSIRRRLGDRIVARAPGGGAEAYKRTFDSIAVISEQARVVALLVALFLVLNTMAMSLAERRSELSLLKLNGARHWEIATAFVAEAAVLGLLGSAVGVAAGVGLGSALVQRTAGLYNVLPFVTSGPIVVSASAVALGIGTGVGVAVLGALLPARRILHVEPIEALRPEASYEWRPSRLAHRGLTSAVGLAGLAGMAGLAVFAPIASHGWLLGLTFGLALIGAALLLPVVVPALIGALRRLLLPVFGLLGRLSGDALLRNRTRATITAGALALSASVVIAVGSSIGSYNREVDRAASVWYAAPLYVVAPGSPASFSADQPLPDSLRRPLSRLAGVKAAYPARFGVIDDHGRQMIIYGMPIAQAARAGDRITNGVGIPQRKLVRALRRGEAVVSRYTARERGLSVGDRFPLPNVPARRRPRIAALFNDIVSFDSLYLELSDYRRDTGDNHANRFAIVVKHGADVGTVAKRLRRFLARRRIPASVMTKDRLRSEVVEAVEGLFSLAKAIQAAALLIAGLIVLNTMLTATFERRREFGIQRTAGMSRTQLAGTVILESVAMSVSGAFIAVALGLGMGFLMTLAIANQLAWKIAFIPDTTIILATIAATIAIGTVAALYPSWLAGRQRLIELVGYE